MNFVAVYVIRSCLFANLLKLLRSFGSKALKMPENHHVERILAQQGIFDHIGKIILVSKTFVFT